MLFHRARPAAPAAALQWRPVVVEKTAQIQRAGKCVEQKDDSRQKQQADRAVKEHSRVPEEKPGRPAHSRNSASDSVLAMPGHAREGGFQKMRGVFAPQTPAGGHNTSKKGVSRIGRCRSRSCAMPARTAPTRALRGESVQAM